ncbi:MAG: VWA domain-containing protein, partial [Holophagales bacterium]|nr:VWA domain-containing protein [Holophagales bacterium]
MRPAPLGAQDPGGRGGELGGSASSDAPDPEAVFGGVVDVELVNLRVWVEDRKGRAIAGLDAGDFEVRVDGEAVKVRHVSEVRGGRWTERVGAAEPIEPGSVSAGSAERPAEAASRLVLYIDEMHLGSAGRQRVFEDLRRWIAEEQVPAENVLVLHQHGALERASAFGSTKEERDAALERLQGRPVSSGRAPVEKQLTIDRLWQLWETARQLSGRDPCRSFATTAEQEALSYARTAAASTRSTLTYLEDVATFLGGLSGFKALLYVGDTLEVYPGADLLEIVHGLCPQYRDANPSRLDSEQLSSRFDALARRANSSRLALYTLQARGLRPGLLSSAQQQGSDASWIGTFDRAVRGGERSGLEQMAQQTGGEA